MAIGINIVEFHHQNLTNIIAQANHDAHSPILYLRTTFQILAHISEESTASDTKTA